jgi:predicted GNAT family acetyltransferase
MIFPTVDELRECMEAAEQYFHTADDQTQSEATVESCQKTIAVEPHAFVIERLDGKLAAYSVALPTSQALKEDFLSGRITERELSAKAKTYPVFESLYLAVTFVLPAYRKRGIDSRLCKEQIEYFKSKYSINNYYAWAWSDEGKALISTIERDLKISIALPRYSK